MIETLIPMRMLDVTFPTTGGRRLVTPRYTQPAPEQKLLLHQHQLTLPDQPPPRIQVKPEVFPAGMLRLQTQHLTRLTVFHAKVRLAVRNATAPGRAAP